MGRVFFLVECAMHNFKMILKRTTKNRLLKQIEIIPYTYLKDFVFLPKWI